MESTQDIILEELRSLRSDFNESARQTGERLATLESQMKDLCGNGQPGRITRIETAIEDLKAWRWRMVGLSGGVGLTVSTIVSVVAWALKH